MPEQDNYSILRSHSGRLSTAASFVNEHYLGTPYGSTPIYGRLLNQRFLMELTNNKGDKIYVQDCSFLNAQGQSLTKIEEEFKNGNLIYKISLKAPSSHPLLNSISYEEAYYAIRRPNSHPHGSKKKQWQAKRDAFLEACDQGLIAVEPNLDALNKAGYTVNHVIHRPNHGLHHSLRAAASIPIILGFLNKTSSASEIEKLQHMMLFSVVGRLDETGFSETGEWGKGKVTYQNFRKTSGLAYLNYCENKEGIYTDLEKQQFAPYRDALVVELMGFSEVASALKAHAADKLNKSWFLDRILKDSNRLVEMGTLTPQEARLLHEAVDYDFQVVPHQDEFALISNQAEMANKIFFNLTDSSLLYKVIGLDGQSKQGQINLDMLSTLNVPKVITSEWLNKKEVKEAILNMTLVAGHTQKDKMKVANELVNNISTAIPKRFLLENAIPEVLVQFIEKNYPTLYQGQLTGEQLDEKQQIEHAAPEERSAVIKRILPRILADTTRGLAFFKFITPNSMNEQLIHMNWAHGLDLSRCYSLEASYYTKLIQMPTEINTRLEGWETQLTAAINLSEDLERIKKQKGFLIIKASPDEYYIQHADTSGKLQYSKIDGENDPEFILKLAQYSPPKETRLSYSELIFHMADKNGSPSGSSQYFGNIQGLVSSCFNKSTDFDQFKIEMLKMHSFLNSIQEMHLRTGERMNFQLNSLSEFQAYLDLPETKKLYEFCKDKPSTFSRKFTSKALSGLYSKNTHDYNYPQAFRIFSDTPNLTQNRDYLTEAVNCARLIDSGPKPSFALKTDEFPEIQSLHYHEETKEILLRFLDTKSTKQFQKLHQELIKSPKNKLSEDNLSITIPISDYKYLQNNRYLKYQLETVPKKHYLEENLIDPDTGEYRALQLIQQHKAVVRLHNTIENSEGLRPYQVELDAMEHPMHNRKISIPSRLKYLLEKPETKETYIHERQRITHPLTGLEHLRKIHLESAPPDPQYQQPQIPELDHPDLATDAFFEEQGGVKNTRFLTKVPYTLLDPTGNTQLFMGAITLRHKYFPIGTLSDIDRTHKGSGKYIWTGRANSWEKLWLGTKESKKSQLLTGVTLEELKKLQRESDDPYEHNELLLRSGKEAIRGFVAPKNTLIDRLNLAAQALKIHEQFGISVPLIILDPTDPDCPKPYTEEMIRMDLLKSVKLVREQQFEFDFSLIPDLDPNGKAIRLPRDLSGQNDIVSQLLKECHFPVSSNPNRACLPKDKLLLPPEDLDDKDNQKIDRFLERLNLPGGQLSQMQQITDSIKFDALETDKKDLFFIKQAALGHVSVIKQLFDTCSYRPTEAILKKALGIATTRLGLETSNTIKEVLKLAAITAIDEPRILQPEPSSKKASNLTAAIKQFETNQQKLGSIAFQSEFLNKIQAAMKTIYPTSSHLIQKSHNQIYSRLGYKALDVFRQMDKAEATLKRAIKAAEKQNSPNDSPSDLAKAKLLLQNPERVVEKGLKALDGKTKTTLQAQIKTKIQTDCSKQNSLQKEMLEDIFKIISDSRDLSQNLTVQMRFAQLRWQSNPISIEYTMSEACKHYLSALVSPEIFNSESKIHAHNLIDALWSGNITELFELDPQIEAFFNIEANKKIAQSILELRALQPEVLKANDDNNLYKTALINQAKILLDKGTPVYKSNTTSLSELNKVYIETKTRLDNQFNTLQTVLDSIQSSDLDISLCYSTEELFEKMKLLMATLEDFKTIPELSFAQELIQSKIKEKTDLFNIKINNQNQLIDLQEVIIQELSELQPTIISKESEITKTKSALLDKSNQLYHSGFKEFPPLKQTYEAIQIKLDTEFKILEAKLKSIHESSLDFSLCINIQEVQAKQKITTEGLKELIPSPFAKPLFEEIISKKIQDLNKAADDQIRNLVTRMFRSKFNELYKKDLQNFGLFRSTTVTNTTSLEDSLIHAQKNNRTQKTFIELGWMNQDGSITKQAPALITELYNKITTQPKSNTNFFKKALNVLQGKDSLPEKGPSGNKIS